MIKLCEVRIGSPIELRSTAVPSICWAGIALRNGTQWRPFHLASGRGRRRLSFRITGAGTKKGTTERFRDLNLIRVGIQAWLFLAMAG
jgi:hypothetical protein